MKNEMSIALISLGSKSSLMIAEALKKYFKVVDTLDIRNFEIAINGKKSECLYNGKELDLSKYDVVFPRGSYKFANLLEAITNIACKKTYIPINPEAFSIAHDKILTHLRMQEYNIPMPKTYLAANPEAAKKILEKVKYPVIMKFPSGTHGKGVMFAESFAAASSLLDALTMLKQPFMIQEYVETGGEDIRAFVVGDKVVAAMKRKAEIKEKRANIHAGGKAEAIIPDNYVRKVAILASEAIGAKICAVDILESAKGPLAIEVNVSPGLQTITKVTKVDLADKIARFLAEEGKKFKKAREVPAYKLVEEKDKKSVITQLDFKADRILLPKFVTDVGKFRENEHYEIIVTEKEVWIKKFV